MLEILKALIKKFEGFSSRVYLCPAGYPTRGYGVRVAADAPPITREDAERELDAILPRYIVREGVMTDTQRAAVSDFVYNLGTARWRSSTFRRKAIACEWDAAASECRRWVWAGGVKLPGLVKRRATEAALLLGT